MRVNSLHGLVAVNDIKVVQLYIQEALNLLIVLLPALFVNLQNEQCL